jgi:hypothetical protein
MEPDFENEQYKKRHILYLKSLFEEQVETKKELTRIRKNVVFFTFWIIITSILYLIWLLVNF